MNKENWVDVPEGFEVNIAENLTLLLIL